LFDQAVHQTQEVDVKNLRLLAAAAFVAVTLGAVASTASATTRTTGGAAAGVSCGTTATIGFMGPTTGPVASIGDELRKWALLAVKQWNANKANKPKIKVVEGDSQFDPAQASTVAQQFASNRSMLAVSGPAASQEVLAVSPIFKKAGFAYVAPSATSSALTNGKNPGFFRVVPSDTQQAITTASYMKTTIKAKHVFIVDDQTSYSQPLADAVQKLLKAKGITTERTSVKQDQTDYSSVVSGISSSVDLVYLAVSVPAKMQLFGEQMLQSGRKIPLFVGDAGYSPDFKIEGSRFSAFAPDIRNLPADRAIVKAYFKQYGAKAPLTTYGPPSYIGTQVVIQAVARACKNGSATRAEVKAEIARTKLKTSILGAPIAFSKNGERVNAKFVIFQIKNGKPVTIGG
jgi:branched-chain amino acid transport system substrate-binding protein